jgi:hypothetical protein
MGRCKAAILKVHMMAREIQRVLTTFCLESVKRVVGSWYRRKAVPDPLV